MADISFYNFRNSLLKKIVDIQEHHYDRFSFYPSLIFKNFSLCYRINYKYYDEDYSKDLMLHFYGITIDQYNSFLLKHDGFLYPKEQLVLFKNKKSANDAIKKLKSEFIEPLIIIMKLKGNN